MIKKKYPTNTPEIKKLSQQAIKGIFSTKNRQKITKNHCASTEEELQLQCVAQYPDTWNKNSIFEAPFSVHGK